MANKVRVATEVTGTRKAASDLDQLRDRFDKLSNTSKKGLLAGFAGGAAVAGIGIASRAVGELTDVIGDSIQAAREEEVSIQKLGTSLRANIPAWDGNTKAIEKTLAARMKLGFSDDEQRDSLAKIVVATKDVNKALEVQRTAMDLARLKGISLAEAGDALIKVEGGQFRALKALGIQLKAGATATDALRAVQKAATGQAEDYANTTEGKALAAQVKMNEALEKVGGSILPITTEALVQAGNVAEGFGRKLEILQGFAEGAGDELARLGLVSEESADKFSFLDAILATMPWARVTDDVGSVVDALDDSRGAAERTKGSFSSNFSAMEGAAEDWRDKYRSVAGDIIRRNARILKSFTDTTQDIIDDAFGPLETRAELHDIRMGLFADEKAKKNRDSSDDIIAALHDEASALNKLGTTNDLTATDVDRFTKDARRNYDRMSDDAVADVEAIIRRLRILAKMPDINKTVNIRTTDSRGVTHAPGKGELRASGGPVSAGRVYTVGERGPETFVPNQSGTILPNGAGGQSVTINVYPGIGTTFTAAEGRRLADAILPALAAGMQRRGILPRTATGLTG